MRGQLDTGMDLFSLNLDSEGFAALPADKVDEVIQSHLSQQWQQKKISRQMQLAALKRGATIAGNEPFGYAGFYDWRGRFYAWAVGLSYQGKDSGKAAVMAAEAKPLGKRGLHWLGVHVATCHGEAGKKGFDARAEWTAARYADGSLKRWVDGARRGESFEHLEFDEPVQCIAAAADYCAAMESGNPETYESAILCTFDATCSGLQVLGSLLADSQTAQQVNVLPTADGSRADIYLSGGAALMDKVRERAAKVDREAALAQIATGSVKGNDDAWSVWWADKGVGRGTVKRPIMVFCYGGKARSMAGYIKSETPGCTWAAATWLAGILYKEVLPSLLPRAYKFMEQLQEVARILAGAKMPVRFTTANGLPFHQEVPLEESELIRAVISKGLVGLRIIRRLHGTIDGGKQATGIAPNIVHSFDALFLQNAVLACWKAGIDSMALVHDCFGCRAGDAEDMHRILRETWVETFKDPGRDEHGNRQDVVAKLWRDIAANAGATIAGDADSFGKHVKAIKSAKAKAKRDEKAGKEVQPVEFDLVLPPIPELGSLDVSVARGSEFLFS